MTLSSRSEAEIELAQRLAKAQRENMRRVREALTDKVDPSALSYQLFEALGNSYGRALVPYLEQLFVDSANNTMHGLVDIEYDQLLTLGSAWAQEYAYILIGNLVATDRRLIEDAVNRFHWTLTHRRVSDTFTIELIGNGQNQQTGAGSSGGSGDPTASEIAQALSDFQRALSRIFSPARAEIIAITEITRAEVEGDRAYANALAKLGYALIGLVFTQQDERTCLVCGAKHKRRAVEVGYPPFHPRCRCVVLYRYEVIR